MDDDFDEFDTDVCYIVCHECGNRVKVRIGSISHNNNRCGACSYAEQQRAWKKGLAHMLVLCRKVGEKIEIGDDIVIMVTDIRGDKCRIGILAPPEVRVHRSEVAEKLRQETER